MHVEIAKYKFPTQSVTVFKKIWDFVEKVKIGQPIFLARWGLYRQKKWIWSGAVRVSSTSSKRAKEKIVLTMTEKWPL